MAKQFNETDALNKALEGVRFAATHIPPRSHQTFRGIEKRDPSAAGLTRVLENLPGMGGAPVMVSVDEILESPYQTSPISEAKVLELVENLGKNPLSTPVVLRKLPDGALEVIAGRHRIEAYKRMGRREIEASVREIDNDEAERLVFYDNLFAPSLTDYQKYLGFAARKESKGLSLSELADEAGVSRPEVSELMAFDKLPEAVHGAMRANPGAIGTTAAPAFAELAIKYPELAVQAVSRIAAGELTQKAALVWLNAGGVEPKPANNKPQKYPVWSARKKYAEVVQVGSKLSVTLPDASAAEAVLKQLLAAIEDQAKQAKEATKVA